MRKMTPLVVGLATLALVAGCTSAGSDGSGSSGAAGAGDTLTIGMPNGSQTNNSNPFMNTSSAQSLGYAWMIYEPLAQVNSVRPGDEPTPWLASEWAWNEDFTSITLTVRDGVKWQDGKDLTAKDVAFSFQIRKDNDALNTDALPYGEVSVDGNTVTVTFTESQYVNQTKVLNLFVVPEHVWSGIADPTTDLNQEPIGTGPYSLKTWTAQAATLVPNDAYWGGKPPVPELRYTSYNDNNALTTALVNGDAQWGWTFIPDFENVYVAKDPEHNKFWYPAGLGIDVLYLNNATAPFNDVAVRQAVNLVIDREQIHTQATSSVFPQLDSPAGIPEPAGTDFIASEYQGKKLTPDVNTAKKILADAGYTLDGETLTDPKGQPVTFTLVNPAGWSDYLTSLQIVADAVKPLGITATVETMNADAWFAAIAAGEFQASMHWTNGGSTPWDMFANIMDGAQYVPLGEKANWNFGRFQDDAATQALKDYATTTDEAARTDALDRVQKIFVEQVPSIAMVGRPIAAEYSTKHWTGWPSEDDPYATPQATMPAASQIVMHLKPPTDPAHHRRSSPRTRRGTSVEVPMPHATPVPPPRIPAGQDEVVLEARALTKHFPVGSLRSGRVVHAVDDVDLTLRRGAVVALVGESGSGKSTVARLLAQLMSRTGGQVLLRGTDTTVRFGPRFREYCRTVQMIFQDPYASLNPIHTVRYILTRSLRIHSPRLRGRALDQGLAELLERVQLHPAERYIDKFPHELSGGQRQRVAIARALAAHPAVLLADEPISMLDVSIRLGILNLLRELRDDLRLAVLYITHDIASARYFADETVVMYAGRIVETGDSESVTQDPAHPYTQLLVRSAPDPDQLARAGSVRAAGARGEAPSLVAPPAGCRFNPRCPFATDLCRTEVPPLIAVGEDGRRAACWLYSPTTPGAPRRDHEAGVAL